MATRTPYAGLGGMSSVDESERVTKLSPSGERPWRPGASWKRASRYVRRKEGRMDARKDGRMVGW